MTASAPLHEVRSEPALFETILELAALEQRVVEKANQSGIGPMGFGGKTTLLGCKIGKINRLPASFFVSVAYMCWAFRRRGVNLDVAGNATEWLY